MIEKGRISALQMSFLIYANIITTAALIAPGMTFKYADRDMWLSPIWGSLSGFLVVFIVYQLNKLYPGETLIHYSQHILGRIPGKVAALSICFIISMSAGFPLGNMETSSLGRFSTKLPSFW